MYFDFFHTIKIVYNKKKVKYNIVIKCVDLKMTLKYTYSIKDMSYHTSILLFGMYVQSIYSTWNTLINVWVFCYEKI